MLPSRQPPSPEIRLPLPQNILPLRCAIFPVLPQPVVLLERLG